MPNPSSTPAEVVARILQLRRPREPLKKFADRVGLPYAQISRYQNGGATLKLETLLSVISSTDVDVHWLMTGEPAPTGRHASATPDERRETARQVITEMRRALDDLEVSYVQGR
jgi:transcriptional regulator with XRE-family HTH domain